MGRIYVGLLCVGVGLVTGLFGFALGIETAGNKLRAQLPELGKVIASQNAGVQLQAETWPDDIHLVPAGTNNDTLIVYMGVVADTEALLTFERDQLVSINCQR